MTLTPQIESRMTLTKEKKGRLPRFDTVAKALAISEEDAKDLLNQYRVKHGERLREPSEFIEKQGEGAEVKKETQEPKIKWYTKLSKAFDWLIDKGSVLVAIAIALILCSFSLWIMGPSDFEKIGFVALAGVIVLFGFRALVKKKWILWIMCELIAAFLGISFVLVGLDYQTNLTADDRQLTALETAETTAADYLKTLQELQKTKGEGYKSQVEAQQKVFDEASGKAGAYRIQVANKPKKAPEIKAYDILLAIPKAILGSNAKLTNDLAMWIALILFSMVFFILPYTLYTTVVTAKKSPDA